MSYSAHHVPETDSAEASGLETQPFVRRTRIRAVVLAILAALLIFLVSVAADFVMLRDHEPARLTIELSDAISSLVIGLLSYRLFRLQQQRREYVRHRVEVIADMNHHVRNALQVISLTTHGSDTKEIRTIRESVNRIQWALRELLPKI